MSGSGTSHGLKNKKSPPIFWWILALAAFLRFAWTPFHQFDLDRIATIDSHLYLELADHLRQTGYFERDWQEGQFALEAVGPAEVFRTPGYPLILRILQIFPEPLEAWLVCLQIILGILAVWLSYDLARRFLSLSSALFAAGLLACDPGHVIYAQLVMSDVLFSTLVIASLWFAAYLVERPTPGRATLLGVVLSATTCVRPLGLLLLLPIGLFLALRKVRVKSIFIVLVFGLLFPVVWSARNSACCGFSGVSNAFDLNLALVLTPKIVAAADDVPRWLASRRVLEGLSPALEGASIEDRNQLFRKLAVETARNHPMASAEAFAATALEMMLAGERRAPLQLLGLDNGERSLSEERGVNDTLSSVFQRRGPLQLTILGLQVLWNVVLWSLALRGTLILLRNRSWAFLSLTALVIAIVLTPSLVVGTARMRLPVTALLAILAGAGSGRRLP